MIPLIRSHALKKGDVLAVARIAGIQAVKKTADIIPLAHSGLLIEGVSIRLEVMEGDGSTSKHGDATKGTPTVSKDGELAVKQRPGGIIESSLPNTHGGINILVEVETTGKTGVEMEALTGVMGAALTIVDMCKAVDKHVAIEGVRVLGKRGGKGGAWGSNAEEVGG